MAIAEYQATGPGETTVREVVRDGNVIAVLKTVGYGDSFTVETQVYGQGSESTEVLHRRPYTFPDAKAGMAFLAEAVTAFTYLGCEIR